MTRCLPHLWAAGIVILTCASTTLAQSVCLPAPRLLTTMPMGAQQGTTVEVTIAGENFEDIDLLRFSHPGIQAVHKLKDDGTPDPGKFLVTVAEDCPARIHEARVMTRLGISSSRVFTVSALPEVTRTSANTSLETAMALQLNSICNASMTQKAVDYYTFEARKDQRIVVDCAAKGIDSKLKAVLIVADDQANDLVVERRGGVIDFTVPEDGTYVIKVHDLTFNGGSEYFYRLCVQTAEAGEVVQRLPSTQQVCEVSWPPHGLTDDLLQSEVEPNSSGQEAQKISLPCDLTGSFYPAADVDFFEFTAKKGETWWIEVASERLGRPTDPAIVIQQVQGTGDQTVVKDVLELSDIPSPVKVSSNGYSYDGPPYNAGSADIIGKFDVPEDGVYRLQLSDLFGGTRSDPRNVYRLMIRPAAPDFAVVAWPLHMELRNGDRNALSKPIALRGGATVAYEVVVIRRDGFNGPIDLQLTSLPEGVSATGLRIPSGQSRGMILITANEDAPRGLTSAEFIGRAEIGGEVVTRAGRFASMAWPVSNAWSEIPSPRLLADIPVSACGSEQAPITIAAAEDRVWEVKSGETLNLPLVLDRRSEFSGPKITLKTLGAGFESTPAFDVALDADSSEAVLDLAKIKAGPGDYTIAFYGTAVARYQYHPEAVKLAEFNLQQAREQAEAARAEAGKASEALTGASDELKAELQSKADAAAARQKAAEQAVAVAEQSLKTAQAKASAKDIADIVVSTPIQIRVTPAEEASQK